MEHAMLTFSMIVFFTVFAYVLSLVLHQTFVESVAGVALGLACAVSARQVVEGR